MNIGIDIDRTLTKYPEFFTELSRLFRAAGYKVYMITGLGHESAVEKLSEYDIEYDALIDTSQYNRQEIALIGNVPDNETIVGIFKQRKCRELGVGIMFDDKAQVHRRYGDTPVFEVR